MPTTAIYTLAWFGLMIVAILNGAARDRIYGPHMSPLAAHQISCLTGMVLFGISVWLFSGFVPIESSRLAIAIGLIWLVMTIAFEFGFFHFVMKHPWRELLADYNIFNGRLWVLVLLWTAILPLVCWWGRS